MVKGLSLANKSQLLFGFAVLVILTAVLSVPWIREQIIVRESQMDVARQLAQAWLDDQIQLGTLRRPKDRDATLRMAVVFVDEIDSTNDDTEPFVQAAYRRFLDSEDVIEHVATANVDGRTVYRYARTLRAREMQAIRDRALTSYHAAMLDPLVANPLRAILVIERRSEFAESQLLPFANKQHAGFLGHALVGSWTNLGADTTNSDLKNNYGLIKVNAGLGPEETGTRFLGLMMGEHAKSAIGTTFNTATTVGFAANVFAAGFPRACIGNFSWGDGRGKRFEVERALETAAIVMGRRGAVCTPAHADLFRRLHGEGA